MNLLEQTVNDFVAMTASKEPTPGGGAIAALTAATGAALAEMVANLTIGKKGYEEVQPDMTELQERARAIREEALALAQADANVFDTFMKALAMPKNDEVEKDLRIKALQEAYKDAASVPFAIGKVANQIFDLAELAVTKGNSNLITDGAIAAINARAAVKSAFLNVRINLNGIKDRSFVAELEDYMRSVERELDTREEHVLEKCRQYLLLKSES